MVKPRPLATLVAVVMVTASGCSSPTAASHPPLSHAGAPGYWTRARLLGADPLRGFRLRHVPLLGQSANAHTALLALRVGALFVRGASGNHFCTASVVTSPGKDLLITAAHCIDSGKGGNYTQDIVFIPDYQDGQAPFGIWTPAQLVVAPQWSSESNPNFDFGFIVLKPLDGRNIEDVLGANRLGIDTGYRYVVRVTGYPSSASAAITCANVTSRQSPTQLRFDCGGFTGGTSGSPWVTHFDRQTRTGTIVGVIGGYQRGGDTPSISYSSYFDRAAQRLYLKAVADEAAAAG